MTDTAFGAILANGTVITWGDYAGGSSAVQDQLKDVELVQGTAYCMPLLLSCRMALVRAGASRILGVIATRFKCSGAMCRCYTPQKAFAAVLEDRSVMTWGMDDQGGDSSAMQQQLTRSVLRIEATRSAFTAMLLDCSVVKPGAAWKKAEMHPRCKVSLKMQRGLKAMNLSSPGANR